MKEENKKNCKYKIIIKADLKKMSDVVDLFSGLNNDLYYIEEIIKLGVKK